jgi:hypothetical protein
MKSIPMADRRLGRSIVLVLSTALVSGYRSLQRSRQLQDPPARAPRQAEPRRH